MILEHNRQPSRFAAPPAGHYRLKAVNHYCGDKYEIAFDLTDSRLQPQFHGYGCAVSKAATSLLMEAVYGLSPADAAERCRMFLSFIEGPSPSPAYDPRLAAFAAVHNHPGRVQCATLSWKALLQECTELLNESG